jgi:hypothetical protein
MLSVMQRLGAFKLGHGVLPDRQGLEPEQATAVPMALAHARFDLPLRRAWPAVQPQAVPGQDRVQGIEIELAQAQAEEIDRLPARQELPQQGHEKLLGKGTAVASFVALGAHALQAVVKLRKDLFTHPAFQRLDILGAQVRPCCPRGSIRTRLRRLPLVRRRVLLDVWALVSRLSELPLMKPHRRAGRV